MCSRQNRFSKQAPEHKKRVGKAHPGALCWSPCKRRGVSHREAPSRFLQCRAPPLNLSREVGHGEWGEAVYTSASQSSKPCPTPTPLTASPGSYSTLLQNLRPGLPQPTGDTDQGGGPKPGEGYTGPFPGRTEKQGAEQGSLYTQLFCPAPHYRWVLCAPLRHTVWRKRQPHARKCRCPGGR